MTTNRFADRFPESLIDAEINSLRLWELDRQTRQFVSSERRKSRHYSETEDGCGQMYENAVRAMEDFDFRMGSEG